MCSPDSAAASGNAAAAPLITRALARWNRADPQGLQASTPRHVPRLTQPVRRCTQFSAWGRHTQTAAGVPFDFTIFPVVVAPSCDSRPWLVADSNRGGFLD